VVCVIVEALFENFDRQVEQVVAGFHNSGSF